MFTSDDPAQLQAALDVFQIPMFAVERDDPAAPFRILAVNESHTRLTGLTSILAAGATPHDLLPRAQADEVVGHYRDCADSGAPQRYREALDMGDAKITFDTSLIFLDQGDGRTRLIGNAVHLKQETLSDRTHFVYDDVRFFSTQAQFQLTQVAAFLDQVTSSGAIDGTMRGTYSAVSGICRSIDRALHDIRDAVSNHDHAATQPGTDRGYLACTQAAVNVTGMQKMTRRICDFAASDGSKGLSTNG